ncbi:MAG: ParB/RepB/Spo0J family partition protein, partial [Deltaproteobacteria bacterium]|nr:ParB/RepB/Spo0J family partition protein [Deltaproteobacteria bacterium]
MFKEIEIKKLTASKENYRAAINAETLKDLAGSIKSKGILQPIIVREAKGKDKFEIVAGHRRFEAAKSVKLKKIPSMVMPLTDEEALEFQITENSQREDPNIMEQAHGFKKLLDMGKHNTKTLAAKIDHSERYVLHRLKLLNIPKEAQEKVAKGEMPIGLALLLSRLNTPAEQKEFYEEIQAHYSETGFTTTESALRILDDYILSMKTAPFDTAECAKCEFRSRNQVTLFPELKKDNDNCLDRACFIEKSKVFYKAKLAKKKKAGFPTLELKEEKFPKGSCKIT